MSNLETIAHLTDKRDALIGHLERLAPLIDSATADFNDLADEHNSLIDSLEFAEMALKTAINLEAKSVERLITLCHTGK